MIDATTQAGMLAEMRRNCWDTFLVYADLLEEDGQLDLARAYRWMGRNKRRPLLGQRVTTNVVGCVWYLENRHNRRIHTLPRKTFLGLPDICDSCEGVWYATWGKAIEHLAAALVRIKPTEEN